MFQSMAFVLLAVGTNGSITPTELRCEYLTNPVGIDVSQPRLSWKLVATEPGARGLRQTTYRILVASSPKLLSEGQADLWDSGSRVSPVSTGIAYSGKPLDSGRQCFWKVLVSDQAGHFSTWSKPATWSMGLLKPSDWKAQWIGFDKPYDDALRGKDLRGAKWIWSADEDGRNAKKGTRSFSKVIEIEQGARVESAAITVTADDQYVATLNGSQISKSKGNEDAWKTPGYADIKPYLKPSGNLLKIDVENTSPGAAALIAKIVITYRGGTTQTIVTDTSWAETPGDKPAKVVASYGSDPWGNVATGLILPPVRVLRQEFDVKKPIKRAVAYSSALGLVELHLNGKAVSDDLFVPGWTDYNKRVYYKAYDVTKLLNKGANAVGALLADGWYAGHVAFGQQRDRYATSPRFFGQINIEYADGTSEVVASASDWRVGTGPIRESDFLMGETYDANMELAGWDKPGFDDHGWPTADVLNDNKAKVEAFPAQTVRPYAELRAQKVTEPTKGVYVLDLGQNMAGFARLRVKGEKGQKIVLRFAERLNPDGTMYVTNLRGARAIDTYVCKGEGVETWQPKFTFHGFQYIEVSGLKAKPGQDDVVGIAISSDTPVVGKLETSDAMMNRLVSNAYWTQRMNFIDIPTDCPQRDERLGWTGDAQAYIRTATYNTDVQAFFTKWLVSLDDAQSDNGQYPQFAPKMTFGNDGGPAWSDAGVICPWTIYDVYGDKELLRAHYPAMKKFIEYTKSRCTPDLLPPAQFHCFGDWLDINSPTPNEVIFEAYFAGSTKKLADAAKVLGYEEDAAKYSELYQQIRAAFIKAYVSEDGTVKGDSQCAYTLAFANNLLEPEMTAKVAAKLIQDIEKRGWHLSTGFVGTRDIMHVLSKIGRNDVAFRLLHNTTFPSWGFTIKNGATSIWERWNGWTPEGGFNDPGMNSFAHYAFGAVVGWMYAQIGGIQNAEPGFGKVVIAPQIDPNLTWAKTSYDSIRGKVRCEWTVKDGRINMLVEVPVNVSARVVVPTTGSSKDIKSPAGVTLASDGSVVIGSGVYMFEAPYKR